MDENEAARVSAALREASYYRTPEHLKARIAGQIAAAVVTAPAVVEASRRSARPARPAAARRPGWLAALRALWPAPALQVTGLAGVAAALLTIILAPQWTLASRDDRLLQQATFDYWRAGQAAQALQLASSDPAEVSPWLRRQARFTAPVHDLSAQGFDLRGARLDQLDDRAVAVVAYRRLQHAVDLFVWPVASGAEGLSSAQRNRDGANVVRWSRDGMNFCAVSDLPADELVALRSLLNGKAAAT